MFLPLLSLRGRAFLLQFALEFDWIGMLGL